MTTFQKIIKYLAIAFAIFLIVSIIGGILTGLAGISFLTSRKDSEIVGEMQNYPIEGEFDSLSVDLSFAKLVIKTAD